MNEELKNKNLIEELEFKQKIADILLTSPEENVYSDLLKFILTEFESPMGYFAHVDRHGTLISSANSLDEKLNNNIIFKIPALQIQSIIGQQIDSEKSYIKNSEIKILENHFPLNKILFAPITFQNKLIGQITLANKSDDYTLENSKKLEKITEYLAPILNLRLEKQFKEEELNETFSALANSEENLKTFFNNVDVLIFILDEKGNILEVNETVKKRLGYEREELLNQSVLMVHPPERKDEVIQIVVEMMEGLRDNCPIPLITKNKKLIPVETTVKKGIWNGKPAFFGITKDISKILISEEKFSKAFHNNPAIAGLSDLETGNYIEVNKTFYDKLGFTPEEVIGKRASEVVRLDLKFRKRALAKLKKEKSIENEEAVLYTKSGTPLSVLLFAEIIEIDGKEYNYTTAIDISEKIRIEEELKNSEEKYRKTFLNAPFGIIMSNKKGDILDVNEELCEILEIKKNEIIGKNILDITHKDDIEISNKKFQELFKTKENIELVKRYITKNNKIVWCRINTKSVYDDQGLFHYNIGLVEDITEKIKIENELKNSEEKFRKAFDTNPDSININRMSDGLYISVNEGFLKLTGYSYEEVIGKTSEELNVWCDLEDRKRLVKELIENGIVYNHEAQFQVKSGEIIFGLMSATIINIEGENCILSITRDITERKRIEDELINSEENFRKIFDTNPDVVSITKISDGKYIAINDGFSNITGYSKDDVVGKTAEQLNIWKNAGDIEKFSNELKQNGSIKNFESIFRMKDGTEKYGLISSALINLNGSKCVLSIARDITERKVIEEKLKESERNYHHIINGMQDAVYVIDFLGNFIDVNKAACDTLGYKREELLKLSPRDIDGSLKSGDIQKLIDNIPIEEIQSFQTIHITKDKKEIPVEITSTLIYYQSNKAILSVAKDITSRKKSEEELNVYKNNLEELVKERTELLQTEISKRKKAETKVRSALENERELNQLKSSFISTVSHEFRTPLTSIYSSVELIERYSKKWDEVKTFEHYSRIKASIEHLTNMLEEVLQLNRGQSNRVEFNPEPTQIDTFCNDILKEFEYILSENQKLIYNYKLSQSQYFIDKNLMKIILSNLLSNAIKFSPNGGTIDLNVSESRNKIKFEVKDQGLGIAKEEINKIFTPFYRSTSVSSISGSGLGLSIIQNYTHIHKGTVRVSSKLNKGSAFSVLIPIKPNESANENKNTDNRR